MSSPARARPAARPVLALDIDGVLNPLVGREDLVAHRVTLPAARLPRSPFILGFGESDLRLVVRTSAGHAAWIQDVRSRADVVWATTWEHAANDLFAPLLGIDPLPVAVSSVRHPPRPVHADTADSAGWKAEALAEEFTGRPLVWVDDAAGGFVGRDWRHDGAPTLVLAPDPAVGLTAGHIAEVEAFLGGPPTG
jgi:hypothetical protein